MYRIWNCLLLACMAVLPVAAQAQPNALSSDQLYCAKLSNLYVRYIGHDDGSSHRLVLRGANDAQVAATQCKSNAAWAIPVLEQQLAANKFTLPTRD